ncbi:phage holin family protein [Salinarimonas soli]|uniref:Phage holin family protein n=1 Tax=Salinarimonas soli TaxID=1638099 RepID=A0A5B2VAX5_9HYPH|nr:phage holin family protein [Salinarimonas soli]KAA2236673.1 phage holin family protein [Salinarimonas soli]
MHHDHQRTQTESIQSLFGEALRESGDLARKELALFRTEMADNVRSLVMGIAMLLAAAVFGMATLILLTNAFVEWLATVVNSEALAALITAGITAAIAIGLGLFARSKFSSITPNHTVRSIQRDADLLSERVSR